MKRYLPIGILLLALEFAAIAQNSPQPGGQNYDASSLRFLLQNPPQQVPSGEISATRLDNPAACSYYYWVVSKFPIGNSSPSGPAPITNGACSLANGNQVNWSSVAGATGYDVLRTSTPSAPAGNCACAVATNVSGLTATDTGTLNAYTVATFGADVRFLVQDTQCSPGLAGLQFTVVGTNAPAITVTTDGVLHQGNCTGPPITPGTTVTPGGANTDVQFNDSGVFGGTSGLTFDKVSQKLSAGGVVSAGGGILFPANGSVIQESGGNLDTAASNNIVQIANSGLIFWGDTTLANAPMSLDTNARNLILNGPDGGQPELDLEVFDGSHALIGSMNLFGNVGGFTSHSSRLSTPSYNFACDNSVVAGPVSCLSATATGTGAVSITGFTASAGNGGVAMVVSSTAGIGLSFANGSLQTNSSEGTAGQVLQSEGPGVSPQWKNVLSNSNSFQSVTVTTCTTNPILNDACSTTVTWPTAFPNTAYKVGCTPNTQLSGGAAVITGTGGRTTNTFVLEIQNLGANASATHYTVDCAGWEP